MIASIAVIAVGCARKEIKLHAVSYNKAISDFGNKQILLNAVRASKRYPMYFSAVGDMTGKGILSGGVTTTFPFTKRKRYEPGGQGSQIELNSFGINPSASLESGLSSVAIANLNTKEFQEAMYTEVGGDIVDHFLSNSWPKGLIFSLFVHRIKLDRSDDWKIGMAVTAYCNWARRSGNRRGKDRCQRLVDDAIEYKSYCNNKPYRKPGVGNDSYFNAGDKKCNLFKFQMFIEELRILGLAFKEPSKNGSKADGKLASDPTGPEAGFDPKKRTVRTISGDEEILTYLEKSKPKEKRKWILGVRFDDERFADLRPEIRMYIKDIKLEFHLRSPQTMIYYLGEVIRAQIFSEKIFVPTVVYGGDFRRLPLFVVRKGVIGRITGAAIGVKHEGVLYYVPRPEFGHQDEDRSLQVIDLLSQIIIHQTRKDDLPKSSTIQLVGG